MRIKNVVAELKVRQDVHVKTEEEIKKELVARLMEEIEHEIDKLSVVACCPGLDHLELKYKIKVSFVDPREN